MKYSLVRAESGTCSGGFLKSSIHSLSPLSVSSSRLMQPPMLWPMTAVGETLFDRIQLAPQDRGEIWIRVAARVAVEPKLVMVPDHPIAAQLVNHWRPRRLRIHQPVDDQHDRLLRIVRLEPLEGGGSRVFLGVQQTRKFVSLRVRAFEHDRERHGEIRGERKGVSFDGDGLHQQRVFKREHATPALEARDGGDAVKNARRDEMRACVLIDLPFHRHDGRADWSSLVTETAPKWRRAR